MDLCPSPEEPSVQPDERGKKLRTLLYYVYLGEIINVGIRFVALGPMAGFFQLIHLWIIYSAYATINFCSCLFVFILKMLQLLYIGMDYKQAEKRWDL